MATVDAAATGSRVDAFLARRAPELSRSRIQTLMADGMIRCNGVVIKDASRRVKAEEELEIIVPAPVVANPSAESVALDILFEDEHLLVLVKPAGMVVHPAPGHSAGTLVNALLGHCADSLSGIGGVKRPGIVHRIDREVSGILVVAKHDRAHIGLSAQFTVHSVERVYDAIVWGVPRSPASTIDRPIGRHPKDRLRMAVVAGGKRAVTRYRVIEVAGMRASRLKVELETGRTHQIRVHLASIGHPIVGDRVYGKPRGGGEGAALSEALRQLDRLALHARVLGLTHPVTGERLRFEVEPPPLFGELLELMSR